MLSLLISATATVTERVISRWDYTTNTKYVQTVQLADYSLIYLLEELDNDEAVVSCIQTSDREVMWAKQFE